MRANLDQTAIRALAHSDEVRDVMAAAGEAVAENARVLAPGGRFNRASQEGITHQEELGPRGWESHVGHVVGDYGFWLRMQEFGTRYQSPRPHLRPASTMRVKL